jgi:hypothetical protein
MQLQIIILAESLALHEECNDEQNRLDDQIRDVINIPLRSFINFRNARKRQRLLRTIHERDSPSIVISFAVCLIIATDLGYREFWIWSADLWISHPQSNQTGNLSQNLSHVNPFCPLTHSIEFRGHGGTTYHLLHFRHSIHAKHSNRLPRNKR